MIPDNRVDTDAEGLVTKTRNKVEKNTINLTVRFVKVTKQLSSSVQLVTKCTDMSYDDDAFPHC